MNNSQIAVKRNLLKLFYFNLSLISINKPVAYGRKTPTQYGSVLEEVAYKGKRFLF